MSELVKLFVRVDGFGQTVYWSRQDWLNFLCEQKGIGQTFIWEWAGMVKLSAGVDQIGQIVHVSGWDCSNCLQEQAGLIRAAFEKRGCCLVAMLP